MTWPRASFAVLVLGVAAGVAGPPGRNSLAADPAPNAAVQQAGATILQALQRNPATAPYRFAVTFRGGQYALSGRVGTKQIHDAAIRTVIALGYPVRDDLTIYTGEADRVATQAAANAAANPAAGAGANYGAGQRTAPGMAMGQMPYAYPPILFGRLDDPFFGLEPPLYSFPPWFGAMSAYREPGNVAALNDPSAPAQAPGQAQARAGIPANQTPAAPAVVNPAPAINLGGAQPAQGAQRTLINPIEMTLDSQGVATLRGSVPTLADRVAVGQEVARTPGIAEVVNLLQVTGPLAAVEITSRPLEDAPPPAPTPAPPPAIQAPAPAPAPTPAVEAEKAAVGGSIVVDGDALARRVADAIARRPALGAIPLRVSSREGQVTLSGRVPSSYDAMLAFRAAEQTPGVREVLDRLEFPVPDVDRPNPLRDKGRPEDVEAYLLAQVRRQIGDAAHVDQVRLRGDTLEVRGTVSRAEDTPRVEAILRSIPLLRGFRLEASFQND